MHAGRFPLTCFASPRSACPCSPRSSVVLPPARGRRAGARRVRARDSAPRRIEPVVVVGARTPATVGGAGAVVVRPDSLPIPTQPAPLLEQVLRQTPFVLVRQNSRGEVELSVRGSDSRQAALLLDGLPLTLGWDHRSDASLIPPTGVAAADARARAVVAAARAQRARRRDRGRAERRRRAHGARDAPTALGTGVDQFAARVRHRVRRRAGAARPRHALVRGGATYRQRDGFALSRDGGAGDGHDRRRRRSGRRARRRPAHEHRPPPDRRLRRVRYDAPSGAYVGRHGHRLRRAPRRRARAARARAALLALSRASRRLGVLSAGTGDRARRRSASGSSTRASAPTRATSRSRASPTRSYATLADARAGRRAHGERRASPRRTRSRRCGQLRVGGTLADVRYDETLDAQSRRAASRYRQRLSSLGAEMEWPLLSRVLVSGGVVRDQADTPEAGGKPALGELSRWGWRVGSTVAARDARAPARVGQPARALPGAARAVLGRAQPLRARTRRCAPSSCSASRPARRSSSDGAARAGLTLQTVGFHHRLDDAVVRITLPNRLFRRVNRDEIRSTGVELLGRLVARGAARRRRSPATCSRRSVRVYDATLAAGLPDERRPEHQPQLRGSLDVGVPLPLGVRGSALARFTGRQFCQHPDLGRAGGAGRADRRRRGAVARLVARRPHARRAPARRRCAPRSRWTTSPTPPSTTSAGCRSPAARCASASSCAEPRRARSSLVHVIVAFAPRCRDSRPPSTGTRASCGSGTSSRCGRPRRSGARGRGRRRGPRW